MQTANEIPDSLQAPAAAAMQWFNDETNANFELTGVVDYESALTKNAGEPFELGLVMCDGEICCREQVRIQPQDSSYLFSLIAQEVNAIPPLLDPPPGLRRDWLTTTLEKHEFVLLLFYRGLW